MLPPKFSLMKRAICTKLRRVMAALGAQLGGARRHRAAAAEQQGACGREELTPSSNHIKDIYQFSAQKFQSQSVSTFNFLVW
jgi:hypothetical protein